MGVGAGLYMCDVVKKFTFAISSPDEFLYKRSSNKIEKSDNYLDKHALNPYYVYDFYT